VLVCGVCSDVEAEPSSLSGGGGWRLNVRMVFCREIVARNGLLGPTYSIYGSLQGNDECVAI
jgi:hypothetical protein